MDILHAFLPLQLDRGTQAASRLPWQYSPAVIRLVTIQNPSSKLRTDSYPAGACGIVERLGLKDIHTLLSSTLLYPHHVQDHIFTGTLLQSTYSIPTLLSSLPYYPRNILCPSPSAKIYRNHAISNSPHFLFLEFLNLNLNLNLTLPLTPPEYTGLQRRQNDTL